MDGFSKPGGPDLAHVGQVIFAGDGRARAIIWAGRRYRVAGDAATQQAIGQVARAANLYIHPTTLELFDHQRRRLGVANPEDGG